MLECCLELVERVDLLHFGGERSISYQVAQLLVDLLNLCAGCVAHPIDEPESVKVKTKEDEVLGREGWDLPCCSAGLWGWRWMRRAGITRCF